MEGESSSISQSELELPIQLTEVEGLSLLDAVKFTTLHTLEWLTERDLQSQKSRDNDDKTASTSRPPNAEISSHRQEFLTWLKTLDPEKEFTTPLKMYEEKLQGGNRMMPFIKSDIRKLLRKNRNAAYSNTMTAETDETGPQSAKPPVFEADTFLYDNIDDALEAQGKEKESGIQCLDCKSTNCEEMDIQIDYSTSLESLAKLFALTTQLLNANLSRTNQENRILILGSGIGSYAYGAFLFSKSSQIVSCEWCEKLCKLQEYIVDKHGMREKVSIENSVCPEDTGMLKSFDIIIISKRVKMLREKEINKCWTTLSKCLRQGSRIIMYGGIQEYIPDGNPLRNWAKELCLEYDMGSGVEGETFNDYHHIYRVV